MRALPLLLLAGCGAPALTAVPSPCVVEVRRTDGAGTLVHRRGYDASGRLSWGEWSETYTGRGREELRYDGANRVGAVRASHHETSANYPGPVMAFSADAAYDGAGRMVALVEVNAYDRDGKRRAFRYRWDERGRLVEASGSHRRLRVSYAGDRATATVEEFEDADGHPWTSRGTLTWDGDRLVEFAQRICNPGGHCYERGDRFAWDERGRLAAWTPREGDAYRYRYDDQGRLIRRTLVRDRGERPHDITWDAAGQVAATVDDEGHGAREERRYTGACAAATGAERAPDPLALVGLAPCVPTRVAGCLAPDGRSSPRW